MREDKRLFRNIDPWLVALYVVLVIAGWLNIYAAVFDEDHASLFDLSQRYGKQMLFVAAALVIAGVILLVDGRLFMDGGYILYGLTMLMLVAVLIVGTKVAGARSWFQVGGISFQPSELAKFATCLALAKYLSMPDVSLKLFRAKAVSAFLILFPAALILLQPDMGSALVYFAFILVLYREGLPAWVLWTGLVAVILFVLALAFPFYVVLGVLGLATAVLIFLNKKNTKNIVHAIALFATSAAFAYGSEYAFNHLEAHQRDRINVLLGKEVDMRGVGYNVNQSMIAIGSGGFLGKGYLQGTQTKFNFVPEQSTDFIFCTVGEEWGFVGSFVILALFLALILRIVHLAERQRSVFNRIYGYGVAALLFFHVFVNVGMAIGLLPVIGIPLPFFSYGGSSLWAFTLLLFVFIKLDASRIW